jgi:hypothetical protein
MGTASPDDLERKPWRAAAPHQRCDLVPVDMVGRVASFVSFDRGCS